ncbi:hypothetical protein QTP88_005988 [Uroleucon formosanum]
MPKVKTNTFLKQLVLEFGEEIFQTDGSILYRKLCETKVSHEKKYNIQRHVWREKHVQAVKRHENEKSALLQPFLQQFSSQSDFNADLCSTLVAANIPMYKLNNKHFREFLSKYCKKTIPDESTLRKEYFNSCYENTLAKIRDTITDQKIWVSIDETTDSVRRNVANVIVGTLQPQNPSNIFVIHTEYLEKVNHSTIFQLFNKAMHILWGNGVKHNDVLLFVSDAAPYMKKAGDCIKALYPKLIHVTCLAHALHNVCEEVHAHYQDVDQLIGGMKKTFLKCPKRTAIFNEKCPELPNPPRPITTRWGTWIKAVQYYCKYFNQIKSVIEDFEEESQCVKVVKQLFQNVSLQSNIVYISTNFGFLPDIITTLEGKGESLTKCINIVLDAEKKLNEAHGDIATAISGKLNCVLLKNKGWKQLLDINTILCGVSSDEINYHGFDLNETSCMKYAPITSMDVECSFSMYKNILSDNRVSFTTENLTKYMVVNSFFNLNSFFNFFSFSFIKL